MDHIIVQLSHFYGTCKIDRARMPLCCWQLSFDFSSDLAWHGGEMAGKQAVAYSRLSHKDRWSLDIWPRVRPYITRCRIVFYPNPSLLFLFFVLSVANRMTLFSDQSRAFQLGTKIPYHVTLLPSSQTKPSDVRLDWLTDWMTWQVTAFHLGSHSPRFLDRATQMHSGHFPYVPG